MPYKIERKEFYTLVQNLDSENILEADLLKDLSDSENIILDLSDIEQFSDTILSFLDNLDQQFDPFSQSLVIINKHKSFINSLEESFPTINISPTLIEAEDIIKMELLEREILNGEEDEF